MFHFAFSSAGCECLVPCNLLNRGHCQAVTFLPVRMMSKVEHLQMTLKVAFTFIQITLIQILSNRKLFSLYPSLQWNSPRFFSSMCIVSSLVRHLACLELVLVYRGVCLILCFPSGHSVDHLLNFQSLPQWLEMLPLTLNLPI